jgi:hypothetical protein
LWAALLAALVSVVCWAYPVYTSIGYRFEVYLVTGRLPLFTTPPLGQSSVYGEIGTGREGFGPVSDLSRRLAVITGWEAHQFFTALRGPAVLFCPCGLLRCVTRSDPDAET